MLFERKTAGIETSASWVSSFASFLPSNPATIMTLTCLFFLGTIVYRFSPPLSPRAQLVQLKNLLDEMIDSDEMSTGGLPIHNPRNTQKFLKTYVPCQLFCKFTNALLGCKSKLANSNYLFFILLWIEAHGLMACARWRRCICKRAHVASRSRLWNLSSPWVAKHATSIALI